MGLIDASRTRFLFEISLTRRLLFNECAREGEIGRPCDLDVSFGTSNDSYWMTDSLDQARFISSVVFVPGSTIECILQDFGAKRLWSLRQYQMLSSQCRLNNVLFSLLHCIDDRKAKNSGSTALGLSDHIFDIGYRNKRPDTIMHGDDLGSQFQMSQSHRNGILTPFAALNDADRFLEARRFDETRNFLERLAGSSYYDVIDDSACIELADGVNNNGSPVQHEKLFGAIRLHAAAETGSCDNRANFHSSPGLVRDFRLRLPFRRR